VYWKVGAFGRFFRSGNKQRNVFVAKHMRRNYASVQSAKNVRRFFLYLVLDPQIRTAGLFS